MSSYTHEQVTYEIKRGISEALCFLGRLNRMRERDIASVYAFGTEDQARLFIFKLAQSDYDYADNFRFAFTDDEEQMTEYIAQICDGCCGSVDERCLVAGREAVFGFNHGH